MTDLREAAQQALERLRKYHYGNGFAEDAECIADLEAALAQQAEPAQEPYTSERHFALREAYCIGAADAFWKARPGTKDDGRTIAFDAGFARGFDKGTCLAEQRLAALAQRAEPVQEPVAYFGSAYVNENGVHITTVLGPVAIPQDAKLYTAPPQRKPLTEEEILAAVGWERAEMYMKLTPNFPVDEAKKETLTNARAIEKASWEKNNGQA